MSERSGEEEDDEDYQMKLSDIEDYQINDVCGNTTANALGFINEIDDYELEDENMPIGIVDGEQ